MTSDKVQLTKEGKEKIEKELRILLEEKRPKLVERLSLARAAGDLAENNDYARAKEELEFLDERISQLGEILARVKVIETEQKKTDFVCLGSTVEVKDKNGTTKFCIVGEWEADPLNKKISQSSPLGKSLLGRKVGDEVEVEAPAGKVIYKILAIE